MIASTALFALAAVLIGSHEVAAHGQLFPVQGDYHACTGNQGNPVNPVSYNILLVQGHAGSPEPLGGDGLGLELYNDGFALPTAPTGCVAAPTQKFDNGTTLFSDSQRHTSIPADWENAKAGDYLTASGPVAVMYGYSYTGSATLLISAYVDIVGNYQVCGWAWSAPDKATLDGITAYLAC